MLFEKIVKTKLIPPKELDIDILKIIEELVLEKSG
jgi:hypothetical protein